MDKKYMLAYLKEHFRGEVNDALLSLMAEKNITKEQLAERTSLSVDQLDHYLSAPNNLDIDTIGVLASAMGVRPQLSFVKTDLSPQFINELEKTKDPLNFGKSPVCVPEGFFSQKQLRLLLKTVIKESGKTIEQLGQAFEIDADRLEGKVNGELNISLKYINEIEQIAGVESIVLSLD